MDVLRVFSLSGRTDEPIRVVPIYRTLGRRSFIVVVLSLSPERDHTVRGVVWCSVGDW